MTERRLRLLVRGVTWPPETFLSELLRGLARRGVRVMVEDARNAAASREARAAGVRVLHHTAGNYSHLRKLTSVPLVLRALMRRRLSALQRSVTVVAGYGWRGRKLGSFRASLAWGVALGVDWDVLYHPWISSAVADLPLLGLGKPSIVSCRGTQINVARHDPTRAFVRDLPVVFGLATRVHCVSTAILEEALGLGLNQSDARVIRPAVDTERFRPSDRPRAAGGPLRLVTTGSLIWTKGLEYLLVALARLDAAGVDWSLRVIGDGPERARLLFTAQDLGIGERVELLGRLPPVEVAVALRWADVFVLSSLSEGLSNAALEAMASGLPVVVTDVGGMREAVRNEGDGFVVPPRDPAAMAEAISRLVLDEDLRTALGAAARRHAVAEFGLERHLDSWMELLVEAVGAAGAPST